jgi:4-amino-4-deoxychorismate lyase
VSGPLQVLVDGEPVAGDWPLDRALQYGDGLFETLTARGGRLRFEALHRQRLDDGCRRLGIPADPGVVWQPARALAERHIDCTVKVLVSRGSSVARGYAPPAQTRLRVLHLAYPAPDVGEIPARVSLVTLRSVLGENPALAGIKHCNRLEQILGRRELQQNPAFEGLMGSSSGNLVSGTMSNVFIGQDGGFVTPRIDQCGVAGIMRAVVLREAVAAGIDIRETRVPLQSLESCASAFITNARMGLVVAHQLDGRALAVPPALQQLAIRVNSLAG